MLFHSTLFGVFFVSVFAGFWLLHRWRTARVLLLLSASYLFYMGWSAPFALLIVFQTAFDYVVALWLTRVDDARRRKLLIASSVVVNLGILAIFKYYDFFAESLVEFLGWLGLSAPLPVLNLVLPVGISFYTFHTLSYTLDVYYRRIEPARNLFEFALAVVFFPQRVAGPIVRAAQFLPQLDVTPRYRVEQVRSGLLQFFCGLFKKVVIADVLARTLVDSAFAHPDEASGFHLLLAIYAYAFQIYGDFSGYTDMALGAARMLGFELPVNFNLPYRARDLRDFWRRWHISLSTFLRDYLYVPLGGNRGGRWLTSRNLLITMLLGGLWHGAAWTFVLWGLFHGLLLVFEHRRSQRNAAEGAVQTTWPPPGPSLPGLLAPVLRIILTFHLVCLGWVLFRAQSLRDVGVILARLFTWAPAEGFVFPQERGVWVLLLAFALHYAPRERLSRAGEWLLERSPIVQGAMAACALGAAGLFVSSSHPFIYFQF